MMDRAMYQALMMGGGLPRAPRPPSSMMAAPGKSLTDRSKVKRARAQNRKRRRKNR